MCTAPSGLATIVRTSWLFGDRGPSFPKTIAELCLERDELHVVAARGARPTYAGNLADAALELARLVGWPGWGAQGKPASRARSPADQRAGSPG